jgi:hypothetical protein
MLPEVIFRLSLHSLKRICIGIPEDSELDAAKKRRRAWCQLLIGQAQIIGATTSAVLLIVTGVSRLTIWVVGITFLVSLFSRLYFHGGAAALRRWTGL